MIYSFKGYIPVVHKSSFVHPLAAVTGNVIIGKDCYVGPGAAIRGDWGQIVLEDGVNVQENCTIHMFPGKSITLMESAHIGHGAIIHGANIGKNVLVGMNTVIMDDANIGDVGTINGVEYTVVDREMLDVIIYEGFDLNNNQFINDVTKVCTSKITDMEALFATYPFNQDISNWDVGNVLDCTGFSYNTPQWTLPQPNFTNCNPN